MNLGGGNPSLIPAAEKVFREHMQALMRRDGAFERAVGSYDGPAGDREFARAIAYLLRRELEWDVNERNIALTNGSQSAFLALFNLLAGPDGTGRRRRILLPLSPEYIGYADLGLAPGLFVSRRATINELEDGLFKYGVDFEGLDGVEDIGAVCVSRPTNPTGNVVTDEEIERLGAFARARDVPLIVDNAYGLPFPGIVFGDASPDLGRRDDPLHEPVEARPARTPGRHRGRSRGDRLGARRGQRHLLPGAREPRSRLRKKPGGEWGGARARP